MKITEAAKKITIHEKGKVQVDIAQVIEILAKLNKIMKGSLYPMIKAIRG